MWSNPVVVVVGEDKFLARVVAAFSNKRSAKIWNPTFWGKRMDAREEVRCAFADLTEA